MAVMVVFSMVAYWNDWFTALIYLPGQEKAPLPLVLRNILIKSSASASQASTISGGYAELNKLTEMIKFSSIITDNLMGAGYKGYSIFAQNFGGLLITANNIFPRGTSSVHFDTVARSVITGNRFHSFYPGMLVFEGNCSENMVSSNHFLRDNEPWEPLLGYDNGLDDLFGLIHINGNNNSITANHISETISAESIRPSGTQPVIIHVVSGKGNFISNNHIVATTQEERDVSDSCFSSQVNALTSTDRLKPLDVTTVLIERDSIQNTVLDSGNVKQVVMDKTMNAFRATPIPGIDNSCL
ncbi:MAG: hypothetical protein ACI4EO_09940 [Blautia sp.]